jgi:UrcA family protein
MKSSHLWASAACLSALLAGGPALADPSAMVVRIARLNLHSQAGASIALQRMSDSAMTFCNGPLGDGPRQMDMTTIKCRRDMTGRAVRRLGAQAVTNLYMAGPSSYLMASR